MAQVPGQSGADEQAEATANISFTSVLRWVCYQWKSFKRREV